MLDLMVAVVVWMVLFSPLLLPVLLPPLAPLVDVVPLTVFDSKLASLSMKLMANVRVSSQKMAMCPYS
ncbi:hypothetical protein D1872_342540 [compost metagenome]